MESTLLTCVKIVNGNETTCWSYLGGIGVVLEVENIIKGQIAVAAAEKIVVTVVHEKNVRDCTFVEATAVRIILESMSFDQKHNAYSAFSSVDDLAAKPALGSDGAASWQDFRKNSGKVVSKGVAPVAPMKKADRLGTGFRTIQEERENEEKVRKEAGDADMYSGYTTFKRKQDRAEIEERKRRKMIESRTRPEKAKYYIKADTFEGWKEDYVFTTRNRGPGYYWDGMDSLKKLRGEDVSFMKGSDDSQVDEEGGSKPSIQEGSNDNDQLEQKKEKKKKKKGKKKKSSSINAIADDPNHPMEQVLNAMRRRTEVLSRGPDGNSSQISLEAKAALSGSMIISSIQNIESSIDNEKQKTELAKYGWEVATDPSTGKTYYFSRKTGERQWDNPLEKLKAKNIATLPDGWRSAEDASGRTYYYHRESGKTSWEKPTKIVINGLT